MAREESDKRFIVTIDRTTVEEYEVFADNIMEAEELALDVAQLDNDDALTVKQRYLDVVDSYEDN